MEDGMKIKSLRMMFTLICIIAFFATVQTVAYADGNDSAVGEKQKVQMNTDKGKSAKIIKRDATLTKQNEAAKKTITPPEFKAQGWEYDENGDYVYWNRSYAPFTLYKGEKLYLDCWMADTYADAYTIPYIEVYDDHNNLVWEWDYADPYMIVPNDEWERYKGYVNINSSRLATGVYYIFINAMPCDGEGYWVENCTDYYDVPYDEVKFLIKPLPNPTRVKAKAGKKKVTVTFKKSAGATKYEIYRSTKKGKGYKKIKTVTKPRYVDRKVKKGKKYFYKVKAVRATGAGVVRSSFTAPAKSGKVKR